MPKLKLFAISFFLLLGFFGLAKVSQASITPPWSTTFSCADWNQYSDPLNCDGLGKGGSWSTPSGHWDQITSAANNPNGGGGKGFRHWMGDGWNVNGGGIKISFPNTREFWFRWYMNYQQGFQWNPLSYHKWMLINLGKPSQIAFEPYSSDKIRWRNYDGTDLSAPAGVGWNTFMVNGGTYAGIKTSDGQWHCYEVHIKRETSGQSDGVAEFWFDGVKFFSSSNVLFGGTDDWTSFLFMSNADSPENGQDYYCDTDDLALSFTGYIGPLSGGGTNPPVMSNGSPINNYTYPSGTSSVTMSLNTDVNANCKYDISDAAYNSMANTFSTGQGTTSHSQSISTSDGNSYAYYARCDVASGGYPNASSSVLSWNVSTDTTPPSAPTGLSVN